MTSNRPRPLALVVLVLPLIAGCNGAAGTGEGCNARIGYDDVVYRPHNALNQAAPRGEPLGSGDVLDCDRDKNPNLGTVKVFAIKGVDPSVAVRTGNGEWRGVYVAEGTPQSSWPSVLKAR